MTVEMTPEQALLRVIHCLDRAHDKGFKAKAFARALDGFVKAVRLSDESERTAVDVVGNPFIEQLRERAKRP